MLREQLLAVRAQAAATVATVDAILAGLVEPPESGGGPCRHPEGSRIEAPRMGAPGGWKCGVCGHEGGE